MKRLKTLFILLISHFAVHGQYIILGKVSSSIGEPLIGASIVVKGTAQSTKADVDGLYRLQLPDAGSYLLQASLMGFSSIEKKVLLAGDSLVKVDFVLEAGVLLDEVVLSSRESSRRDRKLRKSRSKAKDVLTPTTLSLERAPRDFSESSPAPPKGVAVFERSDFADDALQAGTLTAGEIHDFSKWELWNDILETDLEAHQKEWGIYPSHRFMIQLTTEDGAPVRDAQVALYRGQDQVWQAHSDNTGKAELWTNLFERTTESPAGYRAKVLYEGQEYEIRDLQKFQQGINHLTLREPCDLPVQVDIMFVVDATGSMGDEIRYLQTELEDVMQRTQASNQDLALRLGSIFYRDQEDEYLTRKHDLTADVGSAINFIKTQGAEGGGDYPEAMDVALEEALEQVSWSDRALTKLLFLVMDAPPHQDAATVAKMHRLIESAAARGIRIVPVSGSGIDKSTEYLVRSMALATNGTYVFLTDHSGVGNPHLEPTTDSYDVEKFNDLLVRLIGQFTEVHACKEPIAIATPNPDQDPKEERQLHCYPNPTSGIFFIDLKSKPENLFLTDSAGKILMKIPATDPGTIEVNLANFPAGLYYVKEGGEETSATGRIVLNRL